MTQGQMDDLDAGPSEPFWLDSGSSPLVISAPHHGAELPSALLKRMSPRAQDSEDSDWFMRELYQPIAQELGATLLCSRYSRFVVDLNRPPSDESLYPGQRSTGLCPTETFSGRALYLKDQAPSPQERQARLASYWRPYHLALEAELERVKRRHGYALLWEAHSIKSEVPLLFEGRLPDFNLGTFEGRACAPLVERALSEAWVDVGASSPWSFVLNGRFKGGYITRAYGAPSEGVHAVQLELSQRVYLADESRPQWSEPHAEPARALIGALIRSCLAALRAPQ